MEKVRSERKQPQYGAMEKCKAVLSVWTERRKPAEVCKELSIPWMVLSQWQARAMEGMLQALEPRVSLQQGPALSPRLQRMLEGKRLALIAGKLEKSLIKAQEARKAEVPAMKDQKPEPLRKCEKP